MKSQNLRFVCGLLCMLLLPLCLCAESRNQVHFTPLAPLEVSEGQGVAAAYAGSLDDRVLVAGGANFPDVPVSKGGKKVFYNTIFRYAVGDSWQAMGTMPYAAASGASATVDDGVLCVGGTDGEKCLSQVRLITPSGLQQELPALPVGLQQHAVAVQGKDVYVVGGTTDEGGNMKVYKLTRGTDKEWRALAELPGKSRLQCVAVVQSGNTSPCLFVFGGYTQGETKTEVQCDGLSLNLTTLQWTTIASMPEGASVTGGVAVTSGYSHVLLMGGVDKRVFEARVNDAHPDSTYFLHDAAWYCFNRKILVYHTITNSWFSLAENEALARAGASIAPLDNGSWLYVNGEVKPGVRSTQVTQITLENEKSFGWLNWLVLVVYLLGMLGLGYYFMRRESGADDFFKGGGRIPWWAAGISIYATMLSAITYMSIPAKAYATNWTYYPILVTIVLVSIPVVKYYLPYFRRLNLTSAYEYLEVRFNLSTRLLASGLFIVFMVARMALVLYLPSLALTAVTGINIQLCIVLMGIVTIVYCTMGGVEAVVWGDVVQGVILVGGAIFAALFLILNTEGGVGGFVDIAMDNEKFKLFEWSLDYRSVTFWVAIVGGLANNLISYTSDQTVIQRYLTTKDEKSAGRSIMMNAMMCVFISVVFYVIGTGLYSFYQTHPDELDVTMSKGDAIFPFFMMSQMPAGVAGVLIAAVFAATMSTISSNINSVATAFSVDFYKRFRPQTTDTSMLRVARRTCVLSGVIGVGIALLMASWDILSLLDYFNTILGLLTGGLGGLFFIGVFMKRIKGRAALTGFVCGTAFVFWLQFCTDSNLFLFGAAGIAVSVVVAWVVQKLVFDD
ncbi:MAG: sodium/solute symporter [Bacteroidales bacterium]|nr:sodium/solute symporter [Bacteroidales bacterium]